MKAKCCPCLAVKLFADIATRSIYLRLSRRRGKMNIRYRVELSEAERSELGCGRGAVAPDIKPVITEQARFCGVAVTCHVGPADNLAVFAALPLLQAGDVIVAAADGYRETAVVGDLVLGMARNLGAVAFVTDGCVGTSRDPRGWPAMLLRRCDPRPLRLRTARAPSTCQSWSVACASKPATS